MMGETVKTMGTVPVSCEDTGTVPIVFTVLRSLAVLCLVLAAVLVAPAAAVANPGPVPPPDPRGLPLPPSPPRPVVLMGTSGLRWSDVNPTTTPTLAALGETWGIGNLAVRSVRTTTCPVDGWLAVSAGTRAADLPYDRCRDLGGVEAGQVVDWDDYLRAAAAHKYDALPGRLGDALTLAEVPVAGIGPGAAVALARTDGWVPEGWHPRPDDADELSHKVREVLDAGARLVVVDLGQVVDDASATVVDERLHAALAGATEADVLVVSLADRPGDGPALQVAALGRPRASSPGTLVSASTRQTGIVLATDITATLLARVGLGGDQRPAWVAGSLIRQRAPGDGVDALIADAEHASVVQPLVSQFYLGVVVVNIVLFSAVWFGLARPPGRRADEAQRRRVLRGLQVVGLSVAAIPVSLLLANLVPWWRTSSPALALAGAAACVVVALVVAALAGPWRRAVLGPAGFVGAVTAAVLVADVLTGSRLQLSAVFGSSSLLAGRFYGFNNTTFALAAVGTLVAVSAAVTPLVRAGHRWPAAGVVVVVGTGLTIVDGAGSMGADFGGPPALIPAFTLLALMLAGVKITWRRVLAVLAATAVLTLAFALVDWLREPDQRTHLGNFIETVVDGGLGPVLARKVSANLRVVENNLPLTLLTIAGCAFVVAASVRPIRRMLLSPDGGRYSWLSRGTALPRLGQVVPTLVPCLVATGTALVIGLLVNDSGIAIPALGVAVAIPLVIATCAGWMTGLAPADPHEVVVTRTHGRLGTTLSHLAVRVGGAYRSLRPSLVVVGLTVAALVAVLAPSALRPPLGPTNDGPSTNPVVFVGVTGLRWEDVGAFSTPALWDLSRDHAVGQVVVRSVYSRACPVDGWLAVSAGSRLAAPRAEGRCTTVLEPVGDGTEATVAFWGDYRRAATAQGFSATPGLLGEQVRRTGTAATAIGPGASVALAGPDGAVAGSYHARPDDTAELTSLVAQALGSSSLVVVDAGTIRDPGYGTTVPVPGLLGLPLPSDDPEPPGSTLTQPDRPDQAKAVDERIGAVLAATQGTGATVIVVSLADSGRASLRLAAVSGVLPGAETPAVGLLGSQSTRQRGVVQVTDVTPTLLLAMGVNDQPVVGAPLTTTGPTAVAARMALVRDVSRQSAQISKVVEPFTNRLMATQVVLIIVGAVVLVGTQVLVSRRPGRHGPVVRWSLVALRVAAVAAGAVPVASLLTNLAGWWRSPTPQSAFWVALAAGVVAVVAVAFAGPWRRSRLGPVLALATVTFVVLAADVVLLDSRLVIDSPLGTSRLVAGRFYGMNNQGFALFTVAGLIVAAALAQVLRAASQRTAAMLAVVGVGTVVVVIDGAPDLGADFGGPPAQVTAFLLLAIAAAGWRLRKLVILGALGGAAAVTGGFALVDYLQGSHTHLGRFVASVVDGGAEAVVGRKQAANMRQLWRWQFTGPALAGAALTFWLCAPERFTRINTLRRRLTGLVRSEPLLPVTAGCIAAALLIGFALNDSGAIIPAVGLTLAIPALLALAAAWLAEDLTPAGAPRTAVTAVPEPETHPVETAEDSACADLRPE
ncbi:MAG: hypothetical protein FWE61_01505 [Micrococcales bacterium]|nr:hypothetical protein [Micrococcales bacterium]